MRRPPSLRPRRAARERGAALLVALVLVLVSTLLGLSVMESSGVETRLVANEAVRQHAFNAAEAASEQALMAVDPAALSGTGASSVIADSVDERIAVTAEVRFEGTAQTLGFSAGRFVDMLYAVQATATVGPPDAIEARRVVVQGAGYRVPAVR